MNYDKNSFLSGLAVGRSLESWDVPEAGGEEPIPGFEELDAWISGTLETLESHVNEVAAHACDSLSLLSSLYLPDAEKIGDAAFRRCSMLETVQIPRVKIVGEEAFMECPFSSSASAPLLEVAGVRAFSGCYFESISVPLLKTIGDSAFSNTFSLKSIYLPAAEDIGLGAFSGDRYELLRAHIGPNLNKISNSFAYCSALDTLIIEGTSNPAGYPVASAAPLTGTKIAAGSGYIYVPAAMIPLISGANYWSAYSGMFRAIEDYPGILEE